MRVPIMWVMMLFVVTMAAPALAYPPVQELRARDGVAVWLIQSDQVPVITMRMAFMGAGYLHDPIGKEGLAELATGMLMEGAGEMDARAFHQALDEYAIGLSFRADDAAMNITLRTLSEHRERAVSLLGTALSAPQLNETSLAKLKEQMAAARRRARQYPSTIANETLRELVFAGHPYSRDSAGTDASVATITRDDIRQFYRHRMARDNIIIAIAGHVSVRDAEEMAETVLDSLAPKSVAPVEMEAPDIRYGEDEVVTMPAGQSHLLFVLPGVEREDPDFYAAYMLNRMLGGGGFASRMMQLLREEKGLIYSAFSQLDNRPMAPLLVGGMSTRTGQEEEAIDGLQSVLSALYGGDITEADLQEVTGYITGSFPLNLDTTTELSAYLMAMQRYDLGADYLEKRNGYFSAVTVDDLKRVARRLLDPAQLSYALVKPPAKEEHHISDQPEGAVIPAGDTE